MTTIKNHIISLSLLCVDHFLWVGTILILWGLNLYVDSGVTDFWGSACLLVGFFGIIFSAVWRYAKGDFN